MAKYQLDARGSEFRMLSAAISSEQYAIGFKLGNTELRDKVEKTLFEMLDDGSFAKTAKILITKLKARIFGASWHLEC